MIKLFFYNNESPESQMAYQALMQAGVNIKAIEVTGVNVARRLKRIGVTHVPTLYLRDNRNVKMLVGREIMDFLQEEEEDEEDVPYEVQRQRKISKPKREKKVKIAKPPSEEEGSEIISDAVVDSGSVEEQLEVEENSEISSDGELENDKGKLNPKAVMRMMQSQNAEARGIEAD